MGCSKKIGMLRSETSEGVAGTTAVATNNQALAELDDQQFAELMRAHCTPLSERTTTVNN